MGLVSADIKLASRIFANLPEVYISTSLKAYSHLRNSLSEIENDYDLVLIDCPPNANVIVKNALVASGYYIIPAKMDYLSTLGISQLEESVHEHVTEYNSYVERHGEPEYTPSNPELLGVVPMMVSIIKDESRKPGRGREILAAQQEFLTGLTENGHYIFTPVRNNSTVFGAAPIDGITVVLTHPKFYSQTARKIVRELQELGAEFLSRLKI